MLLGKHNRQVRAYTYGTLTHYGTAFQRTSASHKLSYYPTPRQKGDACSHNPRTATPVEYHTELV